MSERISHSIHNCNKNYFISVLLHLQTSEKYASFELRPERLKIPGLVNDREENADIASTLAGCGTFGRVFLTSVAHRLGVSVAMLSVETSGSKAGHSFRLTNADGR